MRFTLSIISFLFLFACSNHQETTSKIGNSPFELPPNVETITYPGNTDLVKVIVKNSSDKVIEEGDLLNGQKAGNWITYHASGKIKTVTGYIEGKKQGIFLQMNQSGQLVKKAGFHQGQFHGELQKFSNKKLKESKMYQNGKLNGATTMYYDDGTKLMEAEYKNDLQHGFARYYNQEGTLTMEFEYNNGEKIE